MTIRGNSPRWCANNGHPKLLARLIGDYRHRLKFRTGPDGRKEGCGKSRHVEYSMSLPSTRQILDAEFENDASVANDSGYTFINIRNCIASDIDGKYLAPRVSIIFAECLQVIDYLAVKIGQTHLVLQASCCFEQLHGGISSEPFGSSLSRAGAFDPTRHGTAA